jgi:hypothetical protein
MPFDLPLQDSGGQSNLLQEFHQIVAENDLLKCNLERAINELSMSQKKSEILLEHHVVMCARVRELEEEVTFCKNELSHTKRQLNDKSNQALAAADRECLLVQILERCDAEKAQLQSNIDFLSRKRVNEISAEPQTTVETEEGSSEVIAKLEDMLESLLALGEQEQSAENARLHFEHKTLTEILELLQDAEMKKLYRDYFDVCKTDQNQKNDMGLSSRDHESPSVNSSISANSMDDQSLTQAEDHETHIREVDFEPESKCERSDEVLSQERETYIPKYGPSEFSGALRDLQGFAAEIPYRKTFSEASERSSSKTHAPDAATNHKKSKWPTPRWNQKRP